MADSQLSAPCCICGADATQTHHIEPRGRRPDLVDLKENPSNAAPTCARCNTDWLIPQGNWRVDRVGEQWVTTWEDSGEVVCRRPVSIESKALVIVQRARNVLDVRDPGKPILNLLSTISDRDLLLVDEWATRMNEDVTTANALAHYEAWVREPWKRGSEWIGKLAKGFECAESTIYEHVRAGELWAEDDSGPPMPWSVYVVCCHNAKPKEALALAREMWLKDGSKLGIRKLKAALGEEPEPRDECECPVTCPHCHEAVGGCGARHRKKAG